MVANEVANKASGSLGPVRAYNEQSQKAGLPILELGIGISYQDSAPMYLMDGSSQIMISKALNESDRLSSCSRSARKHLDGASSLFNVYSFQAIEDGSGGFASSLCKVLAKR